MFQTNPFVLQCNLYSVKNKVVNIEMKIKKISYSFMKGMVFIHSSLTNTFDCLCPPAVIICEQTIFAIQRNILFRNTATYLSKQSFTKPIDADTKQVHVTAS